MFSHIYSSFPPVTRTIWKWLYPHSTKYVPMHEHTIGVDLLWWISMHYPFHRIASHCIALHHITSHHITSHCIILQRIILQRITSYHITSYRITSYRITSYRITSHSIASHSIASHCITSHYIALHRIALHYIALLLNKYMLKLSVLHSLFFIHNIMIVSCGVYKKYIRILTFSYFLFTQN